MASQTITGPLIQYTQDNKFCYGFSGVVGCDNGNTLIMEFFTESPYIDMQVLVCNSDGSGDDFRYSIYLNDIIVTQWYALGIQDPLAGKNPLLLLIPPFTKVSIRADNLGSSNKRDHTINIVGRVYEHLPVRN